MKKIFFYSLLFAAVLTLASCEKDNTIAGYLPVTISQYEGGNDAKVHLDAQYYACWDAGDPVCLNHVECAVTTVETSGKYKIDIPNTIPPTTTNNNGVTTPTTFYAIYPNSAVGASTSSYDYPVSLPPIQLYQEVALGENNYVQKINGLMAACGTTRLDFKNLCALLQVNVSCLPANSTDANNIETTYHLTKIEVTITGNDVLAGNGHVDFSTPSNPSLVMDNGVKTIKLQFDRNDKRNGTYYIVVPPVTGTFEVKVHYTKQVGEVDENPQQLYTLTYAQSSAGTLLKNQIGPVAAAPRQNVTPEEHLPGAFSTSNGVVYFSRGVLKCENVTINNTSSAVWSFEDNQYSATPYVGHSHDFTHSAFMPYSTTNNHSGFPILSNSNHGNTFWEWGRHLSSDGQSNSHWSTLSRADWTALLTTRSASTLNGVLNARYAYAKVNGQYGLMLFPDLFAWPESDNADNAPELIAASLINATNVTSADAPGYNLDQWKELEDAGVVFLPALGYYTYQTAVGSYHNVAEGWYWTSDVQANGSAYYMHFPSNDEDTPFPPVDATTSYPYCTMADGLLVRLVYKY